MPQSSPFSNLGTCSTLTEMSKSPVTSLYIEVELVRGFGSADCAAAHDCVHSVFVPGAALVVKGGGTDLGMCISRRACRRLDVYNRCGAARCLPFIVIRPRGQVVSAGGQSQRGVQRCRIFRMYKLCAVVNLKFGYLRALFGCGSCLIW